MSPRKDGARTLSVSAATYERMQAAAEARGISVSSIVEAMVDAATSSSTPSPPIAPVAAPVVEAVMRKPARVSGLVARPPVTSCAICTRVADDLMYEPLGKGGRNVAVCGVCRDQVPVAKRGPDAPYEPTGLIGASDLRVAKPVGRGGQPR